VSRRIRLILGTVLSLGLVGGLVVSLLSGSGSPSTQPASPRSAQSEFFGIAQGSRLDREDLEKMEATGVEADRFMLNWELVESRRGSFHWPDLVVGSLAAHGIRPVPFVWGTPGWLRVARAHPPVGSVERERAWQDFLKLAVDRYGPGGSYWATGYREQFGAGATPLPITAWQIWNEPNLSKYFAPEPSVSQYARLLRVSDEAITSEDPHARIVLAGMPGYGDVTAWKFLDDLYGQPGIEEHFDAVALHPYANDLDLQRGILQRFRAAMTTHGDRETPLWITEFGWGSAPRDRFGINKGLRGQARFLSASFELILGHRSAWNVQRVFWFYWRDPAPNEQAVECSFCRSSGLLEHDRDPKPAYRAFKRFVGGRR
jgi:polysaccharide biosynthesis protein PslG